MCAGRALITVLIFEEKDKRRINWKKPGSLRNRAQPPEIIAAYCGCLLEGEIRICLSHFDCGSLLLVSTFNPN